MYAKLKSKLKTSLLATSVSTAITLGFSVGLSVLIFTDIPNNNITPSTLTGVFVLFIFTGITIAGIVAIIRLCRDLKNVKKQNVIAVTGVVKKHIWDAGGEGAPSVTGAEILTDNNEELRLSVGELIIGQKYTFQYAPLTKTAVITDGEKKKTNSFHASVKLSVAAGALIFFAFTVLFGALSYVTFSRVDYLVKNGIKTTAAVDAVTTVHDGESYRKNVYIKYEVDGIVYREKLPFAGKLQVGDTFEIRYSPDNPSKFQRANDEYAMPIIFAGGAVAFLFFCGVFFVVWLFKKENANRNGGNQ